MKKIILVLMALSPLMAQARGGSYSSGGEGFNVELSGLIYNTEISGDDYPAGSKSQNTLADVKLGYLMSNQIYFGAVYSTINSSLSSGNTSRVATGLQLGYHSDGYFLDFTYYLSGTNKISDTLSYTDPSGIGLEVGYNTMVSGNFYVGAELKYMSLNYKNRNSSGTIVARNNTFTEMYPMLNAGFIF